MLKTQGRIDMTIGEKITKYRQKDDMTMAELAKVLGVTAQTIYKYEHDIITNIPSSKIELLCKAFKIEPWELLGWAPPKDFTPSYNKETGMLTIPFISQKLSAGFGEEELPEECLTVKTIDVLSSMIKGSVDKGSLVCAEAKGDSMIGANIFSGDFVIFSRGLISGEGIYVIVLYDEVMVKRISFDAPEATLTIISENDKYPVKTVNAENVRILGKVVGWIHSEPV